MNQALNSGILRAKTPLEAVIALLLHYRSFNDAFEVQVLSDAQCDSALPLFFDAGNPAYDVRSQFPATYSEVEALPNDVYAVICGGTVIGHALVFCGATGEPVQTYYRAS